MILKDNKIRNGFTSIQYTTTWNYGYDFMLHYIQRLVSNDFDKNIDKMAYEDTPKGPSIDCLESLKINNYDISKCKPLMRECSSICVAGYSKIVKKDLQFWLTNQTNVIILDVRGELNDIHELDKYMNSIEILTHEDMAIENFLEKNLNLVN